MSVPSVESLRFWALHDPLWLIALLLLPAMAWLRARRAVPVAIIPFAATWSVAGGVRSWLRTGLMYAGLVLLIVALSRPQQVDEVRSVESRGYDWVLALDLSSSMLAEDYQVAGESVNRLQAIRPVIEDFLSRRPGDRIGVVAFGRRAITLAPLTFDHRWLTEQVARLRAGAIEDGTAVGDAIALGVSRLGRWGEGAPEDRLGSFVLLISDGASNTGTLAPLAAAQLAADAGVPVFTVGIGTEGRATMPVFDRRGRRRGSAQVRSHFDEAELRAIARQSGGGFFRATDVAGLESAFAAVDASRPIDFEPRISRRTRELFAWLAWPGLVLAGASLAGLRSGVAH